MIEIVSATRLTEAEFWEKSALGISLRRLSYDGRLVPRVAYENRMGLPHIYNGRIDAEDSHGIMIFVHDDVWIDDFFLAERVMAGLRNFDIIGVAGNRRRVNGQPAWLCLDTGFTWDHSANLSGAVAHGEHPFGHITYFGSIPAECELLDGVFLAVNKEKIRKHDVYFDPRFDFHFYDMDFCRSARESGLRLGTWPICLTHQSGGAFGADAWKQKYHEYIQKWNG